jgi:hypothetical protein
MGKAGVLHARDSATESIQLVFEAARIDCRFFGRRNLRLGFPHELALRRSLEDHTNAVRAFLEGRPLWVELRAPDDVGLDDILLQLSGVESDLPSAQG